MQDDNKTKECNITAHKQAAEALRMSEEKYRWVLNNTADVISVMDMNLRFTYVSPSIMNFRGYTAEEAIVQTFEEVMTRESLQISAKVFEEEMTLEASGTADPDRIRIVEVEQYRKDGSIVLMENHLSFLRDEAKKPIGIIAVSHDITERKQAEDKIKKQTDAMESAIDGIAILNKNEEFTYLNQAHARIYGYENARELIGKLWRTLYDADEIKRFDAEIMPKFGQKRYWQGEALGMKKDGSNFPQEISLTALENGGLICIVRDITDRKRAEEELLLKTIVFDSSLAAISIADIHGTIIQANVSFLRVWGYQNTDEVIGKPMPDFLQYQDEAMAIITALNGTGAWEGEFTAKKKDGSTFIAYSQATIVKNTDGEMTGYQSSVIDVSERKLSEEAVRQSEEKYRNLFENANEAIFVAQDAKLVFVNPMTVTITGYSGEELASSPFTDFIHADDRDMVRDRHVRRLKGENIPPRYSFRVLHKKGGFRWVELDAVIINWKGRPASLNFISDITERKRAEKTLKESENKYRLLADNVNDVIFVLDMNLKYTYVSPSVEILRGFKPEEVLKHSPEETLTPSSWDQAVRTLSEVMELEKSGNREISESRTVQLEMWRKDGTTVWTEVKFSFIRAQGQRAVSILGVTRDITDRKKAEGELQQTFERLRKAINTTIQVMVSAVETRDPYTAGHQVRSADLARAIATEMGLSQERIDGIHMAGSIHDIGKMSVPAEILVKPTKLSELEFSLIKEHAKKGFEMLKDVESPWPLAEIVHQHHERMNGSGYPRQLKGEEIILEARILAVADVVEAMASHRPYRPAIGLNAALAEIENNKGTLYDADAVDACLRLFRERGFELERT